MGEAREAMNRIKLTKRQIEALEIAGAFEPFDDGDPDPLPTALSQPGILMVQDHQQDAIVAALYDAANSADDGATTEADSILRAGYRGDREVLGRLASKVLRGSSDNRGLDCSD